MAHDEPLIKTSWEDKTYDFPFEAVMQPGRSVASVDAVGQASHGRVAGSDPLSLGTPSASGTRVQVKIGGGTSGERYTLSARATDNAGDRHELLADLVVRD